MSEFTKPPQTRRKRTPLDPNAPAPQRARRAVRRPRAPRPSAVEVAAQTAQEASSATQAEAPPRLPAILYEEKIEPIQYYYPSGTAQPETFVKKPRSDAPAAERPKRQRSAPARVLKNAPAAIQEITPKEPESPPPHPRRGFRKPQQDRNERPQRGHRNEQRNEKPQRREPRTPESSRRGPSDREQPHAQVSAAKITHTHFFLKNVHKEFPGLKAFRNQHFLEDASSMQAACQGVELQNPLDIRALRCLQLEELIEHNKENGAKVTRGTKSMLVYSAIRQALESQKSFLTEGVLELLDAGDGIVLDSLDNYKPSRCSVYIPAYWMRHYGLRRGQTLQVQAVGHKDAEGSTPLWAPFLLSVEGQAPEQAQKFPVFEKLEAHYPTKRIFVEQANLSERDRLSMRAVDLLTPIGLGQRALVVAPPRAGKTLLLQGMAHAIRAAQPDAELIVLLIDERPEEIADFQNAIQGEVISSTFDEPPESHIHISELVIEKARKRVESGHHVVLFLDSITRLARAHNALMGKGGRTLSGGVDAMAMQHPRRFFSSARNIEGGGSLTIIATVLVETQSRMDDIIFEEIKGTGNMELYLDSDLANKRVFPAIHWEKSGTRNEELLYHPSELQKVYALRRLGKGVAPADAMQLLLKRLKQTQSNAEFLLGLEGK